MPSPQKICLAALIAASTITYGCGSSSSQSASQSGSAGSSAGTGTTGGSANAGSPAALSAEAKSKATGDIPDNQVFLVFKNGRAGYSIKYPEGWTQEGAGGNVTFKDKNNLVHIVITHGPVPSTTSASAQLNALKRSTPRLAFTAPHPVQLGSTKAIKVRYTTQSAPNPVTGKRVTLIVDRYELGASGRVAVVDLGTQVGVDNVDAYRMMIQSFHWR
jgi:hypothetical protein